MTNEQVLAALKGGLVVSCQALESEPLHSPFIMGKMAHAATLGGAAGIRCNTVADINEIRKNTSLPLIAIIKKNYGDCPVYITPTMQEVDALVECGCEIIALDATNRPRPDGKSTEEFFKAVRQKYPNQLFMADTACYSEGVLASEIGFDLIGTTLSGYTDYTKGQPLPDFELMRKYVKSIGKPIVAEGGIWSPGDLKAALECGVHCAVVGTAITRPMDITKRFVAAINSEGNAE